jgi:tetratricopeptide (TPR) repeat protein
MLNICGQSMKDMNLEDEAVEYFTEAIAIGYLLFEEDRLEDLMSLVFAYVMRGDIEQTKGFLEPYFIDRRAAISLLEELLAVNKLDDMSILIRLHQDVASAYLTLNMVKEAEEHLMREVVLNLDGAEQYIREYVVRDKK